MLDSSIYEDMARRSGGDIYVGVVGPVRTGKSTLVKKFMTELVLPNVEDERTRAVAYDSLPQSAAGRMVMTTEPKFVPGKAVKVRIENAEANVRFCDCVGFVTDGAQGFDEDGTPRLVKTPWSDQPLPFAEAAAFGTDKVICDHSTIGLCVTTDGSITDIPREGYVAAEERTVAALQKIGKPFVVVLNCREPQTETAQALRASLQEKYHCTVVATNCEEMSATDLMDLLKSVLFEFPVTAIDIQIPDWLQVMPAESSAIAELLERVKKVAKDVIRMKDCVLFDSMLEGCRYWQTAVSQNSDLSQGKVVLKAEAQEGIFFEMLSEIAEEKITGECALMQYIRMANEAKRGYDKLKDAFECARVNGYGIVEPSDGDMSLEAPTMVRKNGNVGIQLKATAPSYHIVRVDVRGEVNPIMGSAAQSEQMVQNMMNGFETDPDSMWETNLFGKSLRGMVKEGLAGKVNNMPEDTKVKMRRAITRMVNESKGGVICIIL
jgi:stage IV sporulation protein A